MCSERLGRVLPLPLTHLQVAKHLPGPDRSNPGDAWPADPTDQCQSCAGAMGAWQYHQLAAERGDVALLAAHDTSRDDGHQQRIAGERLCILAFVEI